MFTVAQEEIDVSVIFIQAGKAITELERERKIVSVVGMIVHVEIYGKSNLVLSIPKSYIRDWLQLRIEARLIEPV